MNRNANQIAKLRRMLETAKTNKNKIDVMWITKELRGIATGLLSNK